MVKARTLMDRAVVRALVAAGLVATPASLAVAQVIPAFPGADGAGANVAGGRGGIVYHVTKLDASYQDVSPGTLRYGLNNANFPAGGPRTIVFDVGGRINLGRVVAGWDPNGNGWDTQSRLDIPSNITIAGQTAPSPVNIMGGVVKMGGTNSILRNVTIAPGYGTRSWLQPGDPAPRKLYPDSYVYDAIDITGNNLMIDHVSTVYATDETISANEFAHTLTIQYSNISQGQNYPQADAEASGTTYTGHALGSLLQAGSGAKVSVHHNLYAQQKGRLPRVGSEVGTGAHNDFRNNVFYNWLGTAGSGASGQPSFNKFVGNVFLAGPGGQDPVGGASTDITTRAGGTGIFSGANATGTRVFHSGNVKDLNKNGTFDAPVGLTNADFGAATFVSDASFAVPYAGVTDTAAAAYERVLNYMGPRWWERDGVIDTVDERLVQEVRTGTGAIKAWADDPYDSDPNEGVEWRNMVNAPAVARPADWDEEADLGYGRGDGMPSAWEVIHGLDPAARDDAGDFDADGYTNLEEYLNDVAAWPAPRPIVFSGATNGRYEQITNWDIRWQPSRYDEAQVRTGAVTIDSPGQRARVLKVAPSAGDDATLTIAAGWIEIAQQLEVANAGRVIVDGGQLRVPSVRLADDALLQLAPGRDKVLRLASFTITGAAKIDLGDNRLIVEGASAAAVEQAVAAGYNGGGWDGPGIVTSMPGAPSGLTALAIATAGQVGLTQFGGAAVDDDDVLVMYTYGGDTNFDGKLDADDYGTIDFSVLLDDPVDGYYNGDFNYDGVVNADDYGVIDFNILAQTTPFPTGAAAAAAAAAAPAVIAVPEPGGVIAAAVAALTTLTRRRRR